MAAKDPRELNLLIAGCCRDVVLHLDKVFANVHRIGNLFKSYQVFVVESDSSDNTLQILRDYSAQSEGKITVLSLGNLRSQYDQRTERLAICRNAILDHVWAESDRFDYLLMMDFDNVTAGYFSDVHLDGVKSNFTQTDWTVVTPGNPHYYYDIWALRWPGRLNQDYNQTLEEEIFTGVPAQLAQAKANSWNWLCTTRPGQAWFSVHSAFGGAAFYDLAKMKPEYRYTSWIDYDRPGFISQFVVGKRRYRCEHVGLHESIIKDDGKIYINPNFVLPLN